MLLDTDCCNEVYLHKRGDDEVTFFVVVAFPYSRIHSILII